jgi:hypothetical protein
MTPLRHALMYADNIEDLEDKDAAIINRGVWGDE